MLLLQIPPRPLPEVLKVPRARALPRVVIGLEKREHLLRLVHVQKFEFLPRQRLVAALQRDDLLHHVDTQLHVVVGRDRELPEPFEKRRERTLALRNDVPSIVRNRVRDAVGVVGLQARVPDGLRQLALQAVQILVALVREQVAPPHAAPVAQALRMPEDPALGLVVEALQVVVVRQADHVHAGQVVEFCAPLGALHEVAGGAPLRRANLPSVHEAAVDDLPPVFFARETLHRGCERTSSSCPIFALLSLTATLGARRRRP
mmetsp:Transcript_8410/g.20230  ORF Transcript_8410/g.20230 Transcript_8410/m.20230 type:complete len:261 (-) Transcript_8410:1970-2752(-)